MCSGKETNSYIEILNIQLSAGELLDIFFFMGEKKHTFCWYFSIFFHLSIMYIPFSSNEAGFGSQS